MTDKEMAMAKNKKNTHICLLITLVSWGILIILSLAFSGLENAPELFLYLGIALGFAGLVGLITSLFMVSERKQIKRSHCSNCGKKFDYEDDVSWELLSTRTTDSNKYANMDVICECSECGEVKNFQMEITIASIDKNGNLHQQSVEGTMRKYFK